MQTAWWRDLFEDHPAVGCLIDPRRVAIVEANTASCSFFDMSKDELRNLKNNWFVDVSSETLQKGLEDAVLGRRSRFIGSRICASGEMRTVEALVSPVKFGEVSYLFAVAFDITERVRQERTIFEKTAALEAQMQAIEEKNTAIREIAAQLEASKHDAGKAAVLALENELLPIAARLRECNLCCRARRLVDVLEKALRSSPDCCAQTLTGLSARESEICNLIRNGLSSKEIARVLGISYRSVENHRLSIRRKLGFTRKTNLSTYLTKQNVN